MIASMTKTMLFHRTFRTFTGGHMKVLDYYRHTQAAGGYRAEIYVSQDSRPDHLWRGEIGQVAQYLPSKADVLFVAGMDWKALDDHPGIEERIPVINLIQSVRHASPARELHRFLSRRATRICVSAEVAAALDATGRCNGTIHVIPAGIDQGLIPPRCKDPPVDVFICGYKRPQLALDVAGRLARKGLSVDCLIAAVPRPDFLARMSRARLAVLLPYREEGFYLPALEAMVMGCVVICPDCIGNRSFCINGVTAVVPKDNAADIEAAVTRIARSPLTADELCSRASTVSLGFDVGAERVAYHQLLEKLA
jgi:hypothetical protein